MWCTSKYTPDCKYMANDKSIYIPRSQFPILDIYIFYPLEMGIFLFFWFCIHIKKQCVKQNKETKIQNAISLGLIIAILISDIIRMTLPQLKLNMGLLLKPFFLLFINRNLRNNMNLYKTIVSKGIPIILAMTFNMLVFAGIGRLIFANSALSINYFYDFWETMFNLLVC